MGRTRARTVDHPTVRLSSGAVARVVPSEYGGGYELLIDDTPQSHIDLDDPTHLHFEYIVRMSAVIDRLGTPGTPLTTVHLGAGGMTLPRYIASTRPGSRQQVIELEASLVELVRETLPLPRGAAIRVRIADAREGIRRLPQAMAGQVDLVIADVYSGAQTPAHLTSIEFYREIAILLGPGGTLLVNVADGPGLAFTRRQTATIAAVLPEVAILADAQILKGRRFGNLVIAASSSPLPSDALPRILAAGPHPATLTQGAEIAAFARDATIVTDATATDSPRADASLFLR